MKKKNVISLIASAILFAGCGGGGGGGSSSSSFGGLGGIVSDPIIAGSAVQVCLKSDLTNCLPYLVVTNGKGEYRFNNLSSSVDLSQYIVKAEGGTDTLTGVSFDGITLQAPANLTKSGGNLIISPITTLVAEKSKSTSLNAALTEVAGDLGLPINNLHINPTSNINTQKAAMMITSLKKVGGTDFKDIEITNGDFNAFIQANYGADAAKENELTGSLEIINDSTTTVDDVIYNFAAYKEVFRGFGKDADKTNLNVIENTKKIAKEVAKEYKKITNPNLGQLAFIADLASESDLTDSTLVTPDVSVPADININDIKNSDRYFVNVKSKLSTALGNDSDKKRDYYYSSNESHLNKAEALISDIRDASITDDVFLNIIMGYIRNNQITLAEEYAKNRVYKSHNKAEAQRRVAEAMTEQVILHEKALLLLNETFDLFKRIYAIKTFDRTAAGEFRYILNSYTKLINSTSLTATQKTQASNKSQEVQSYIEEKVKTLKNFIEYASYHAGLNTSVLNYIEKGDLVNAEATLDYFDTIADQTPHSYYSRTPDLQSRWHYKTRISAYLNVATGYVNINKYDKAKTVIAKAQALRANDGISANGTPGDKYDTATQSNSYADDFVGLYARMGEFTLAETVFPTFVGSSKQNYIDDANIVYATELYKTNYSAAVARVDMISNYVDKMYAYTYNGTNKGRAYIALDAINNGDNATAKQAIDSAVSILETEVSNNTETRDSNKELRYIRYGYPKLAELYDQIGETALANTYYDKGIAYLNDPSNISGLTDRIQSYIYIENDLIESKRFAQAEAIHNKIIALADDSNESIKDRTYRFNEIINKTDYRNDSTLRDVAQKQVALLQNKDIGESTASRNPTKRITYLKSVALLYTDLNDLDEVKSVLEMAVQIANEEITNVTTRISQIQSIAESYATANLINEAEALANTITFTYERRVAKQKISLSIAKYDAFSDIDGITVDFDKDGLPDFYDSGTNPADITLALDDDMDGDGDLDATDLQPLYNPNP